MENLMAHASKNLFADDYALRRNRCNLVYRKPDLNRHWPYSRR